MGPGPTPAFFADLAARGHEPLVGNVSGVVRFDFTGPDRTDRWYLTIDKGNLRVSRDDHEADLVISGDTEIMHAIVSGEQHGMSAWLRGLFDATGDVNLLWQVQRLLPAKNGEQ